MASVISRSISSPSTRRVHYQSQISNASFSLSQSFSPNEFSNINEPFSSSFVYSNPLVTVIYSTTSLSKDNQQVLLNSYASCRRLLDHMKPVIGVQQDDTIDLMDNEGKLKDLNTHSDEYASQYLTARNTYYVLKVESEATGDKRYTANFNLEQLDPKLYAIINNALGSLNKSGKQPSKNKLGTGKQTPSTQTASIATLQKIKRSLGRK